MVFLLSSLAMVAIVAPFAGYEMSIVLLAFISGSVAVFFVAPRLLFLLLKKVEWEFTATELRIKNFSGRTRTYQREDIQEVFIMRSTDADFIDYVDIKYWVVLKVPDHIYEDGKLYLFVVQGINSKHVLNSGNDLMPPQTGMEDTEKLARMIAEHWEIPFN
jgi:hypothetical protein